MSSLKSVANVLLHRQADVESDKHRPYTTILRITYRTATLREEFSFLIRWAYQREETTHSSVAHSTCLSNTSSVPYLIDYQVLPLNLAQRAFALQNTFVGRDEYVPLIPPSDWVFRGIFRHELEALVFCAAHFNRLDGGAPCFDFTNPVRNNGFRRNDQVRTRHSTTLPEVRKERNRLQRLSKAPANANG